MVISKIHLMVLRQLDICLRTVEEIAERYYCLQIINITQF